MSRTPVSITINDLSIFARSLAKQWPESKPGHLALLNMLSRAAGFSNFQHLKAGQPEIQPPPGKDFKRWARLLDQDGKLLRWPSRRKDQLALLWYLYSRMPAFSNLGYRNLDEWIKSWLEFPDHVLVRRELVELNVLERTRDGRAYWTRPADVPEEYRDFVAYSVETRAVQAGSA